MKGINNMRPGKIKNGFTLIELLVVIAIIALLTSVLLPALKKAKDLAKKLVCSSQMHQLGISHFNYSNEFNQYIVPATQDSGTGEYWYNTLGPYFSYENQGHGVEARSREMLKCPMDKLAYPKALNPHGMNPEGWLSYAINSQPTRHATKQALKYAGAGGNKATCLKNPAGMILHVDFAYRAWVCDSITLTKNMYGSEPGAHYDKMSGVPKQHEVIDAAYRHNGRINVLWLDGHVEAPRDKLPSAEEKPGQWGHIYTRCNR